MTTLGHRASTARSSSPIGNRRHPHRRRGLGHPVIPGRAEEDHRTPTAGTGGARRRTNPGVAAVAAVTHQQRVAAVAAVTAGNSGVSAGAAATAVAADQPSRAALTAVTAATREAAEPAGAAVT